MLSIRYGLSGDYGNKIKNSGNKSVPFIIYHHICPITLLLSEETRSNYIIHMSIAVFPQACTHTLWTSRYRGEMHTYTCV